MSQFCQYHYVLKVLKPFAYTVFHTHEQQVLHHNNDNLVPSNLQIDQNPIQILSHV